MHFHNAIRKYGIDDFNVEILRKNITNKISLECAEIFYIALYDTYYNGYNMVRGGKTTIGYKHSNSFKKKQSKRMRNNAVERIRKTVNTKRKNGYFKTLDAKQMHTKECMRKRLTTLNTLQPSGLTRAQEIGKKSAQTKKELGIDYKGSNNPFYGKTHSDLSLKKISFSLTGKKQSAQHVKNAVEAKKNKPSRTCPHCQLVGRGGNMTRYHFDNCKELKL